jgi:superoxide dismutase, Fe-Mn family
MDNAEPADMLALEAHERYFVRRLHQGETLMHHLNRRQLLQAVGASAATLALAPLVRAENPTGFSLPKLPYDFDALEPYIDAKTMEIHHDKHHQAYVTSLNTTLKDYPELLKKSIVALLKEIDQVPEKIKQAVINFGGGHANHSLFWVEMGPKAGGEPEGALAKAIDGAFESFAKFQTKFNDAAGKRFGSGWAWLISDDKGKLDVISTANQDSPYLKGQTPLLGLDVWEHAYYLKYQNKRADYVKAWWNTVNWKYVAERHANATK